MHLPQQLRSVAGVGIVAGLLVLIAPGDALAQRVLHVPSEYPTIQAGIDAAETNDTVLVAEGSYEGKGFVNLDFRGKAITVRGENQSVRIWDSKGGDGVRFVSGETSESVLDGIRFELYGGLGLRIENSSPTILNCRFEGVEVPPLVMIGSSSLLSNVTLDTLDFSRGPELQIIESATVLDRVTIRGAPLTISQGTAVLDCLAMYGVPLTISQSTAVLSDCSISGENPKRGRRFGGGVSVTGSSAEFTRCRITGNRAGGGDHEYGAYGGGIYIADSDVRLVDCLIEGNQAVAYLDSGDGGGAFVESGNVTFDNCVFRGNVANAGGGVRASVDNIFTNCTFEGNRALGEKSAGRGGGAAGGGHFIRCTFRGNSATGTLYSGGAGGGMYIDSALVVDSFFDANVALGDYKNNRNGNGAGVYAGAEVAIRGSTFVNNMAEDRGGAVYLAHATATIANCVAWNNSEDQITDSGSVSWSNVQNGYPGEGNIDLNPRFVDPANGDYRLGDGSPCIDAGSNSLVPPESEFDLDGNPRFVNDLGMPDMGEGTAPIVDMGCYEFQSSSTDLNLALRSSCPDGGSARIGWANASPERTAVLLISPGTGTIRIPNRYPCAGTELGLASTGLRIAWQGRNDADGGRVLNTTAPPGACGQFVQLLDASTCNVSEVKRIE